MALTVEELAPWHLRKANFERVIGRTSYITIQDGWPFGSWATITPATPIITAPIPAITLGACAPCSTTSSVCFTCSAAG